MSCPQVSSPFPCLHSVGPMLQVGSLTFLTAQLCFPWSLRHQQCSPTSLSLSSDHECSKVSRGKERREGSSCLPNSPCCCLLSFLKRNGNKNQTNKSTTTSENPQEIPLLEFSLTSLANIPAGNTPSGSSIIAMSCIGRKSHFSFSKANSRNEWGRGFHKMSAP